MKKPTPLQSLGLRFNKAGFISYVYEKRVVVYHCKAPATLSSVGAICRTCGFSKGMEFTFNEMTMFLQSSFLNHELEMKKCRLQSLKANPKTDLVSPAELSSSMISSK